MSSNYYFEPSVIEKTPYGERSYDVYSRLLKDRVVFLRGEVNEALANSSVAVSYTHLELSSMTP